MGKYNVINCRNIDADYQSAKIIELNHIANELAEANRLKREELDRMEHPTTDAVWNRMEDQA